MYRVQWNMLGRGSRIPRTPCDTLQNPDPVSSLPHTWNCHACVCCEHSLPSFPFLPRNLLTVRFFIIAVLRQQPPHIQDYYTPLDCHQFLRWNSHLSEPGGRPCMPHVRQPRKKDTIFLCICRLFMPIRGQKPS